jgi:phosphatidylinositol-3-phosphatase
MFPPTPPAHVVVIVEENKDYSQIIGDTQDAPYLNELAKRGALFTRSYAVTHPSQPNYLALFAGVTDENGDGCPPSPLDPNAPNLAEELAQAHRTFAGYSEDLPATGSHACRSGDYARKHVPWVNFANVPDTQNLPYSLLPPYPQLPTVSFIIPNQLNDMHSASIARGDAWLKSHVGPLVAWAMNNNTLVIVTWDENNGIAGNHIPTIFVGPMVRPGRYDDPITHYRVLRTIEDLYGLHHAGASAGVAPITEVWAKAGT